jgi:cytochrome c biogenesis protein CcmG/thiol:disulfide interchange protein DsbE
VSENTQPVSGSPARRRINWPVLVGGAAVLLPLVAILASGFGKDPHYIPVATVGKPAADFALQDLDGNTVKLSELRGHPVVLNFWSTWCGPCKMEFPVLQTQPPLYPDVKFVGAIYSDDPNAVRRWFSNPRLRLPYPQLIDPEGRTALDFGVSGVPETYFINGDGMIVHKHVAPIDPDTLRACIELARAKQPEPQLVAACDPEGAR